MVCGVLYLYPSAVLEPFFPPHSDTIAASFAFFIVARNAWHLCGKTDEKGSHTRIGHRQKMLAYIGAAQPIPIGSVGKVDRHKKTLFSSTKKEPDSTKLFFGPLFLLPIFCLHLVCGALLY